MYTLMFFKPPFNPGEKLAQINGNIKFPPNTKYSKELVDLLLSMLRRDPKLRIGTGEVWSIIDSLKEKINRINQLQFASVRANQQNSKSTLNLHIGNKPEIIQ
jgi:serine/threonine protein kinase